MIGTLDHLKGAEPVMGNEPLAPIDECGCGDIGYLTTRTVPIDLAHGAGKVHNVPVYHCRAASCDEYTLPPAVARRLETIAEKMEETGALDEAFSWTLEPDDVISYDPSKNAAQTSLIQGFTLRFAGREYEDAETVFVVPSVAVFFRSKLDKTEHYVLRYEPELSSTERLFSLSKFYVDEPALAEEVFEDWAQGGGQGKELGVIRMDDVEDILADEFGDTY